MGIGGGMTRVVVRCRVPGFRDGGPLSLRQRSFRGFKAWLVFYGFGLGLGLGLGVLVSISALVIFRYWDRLARDIGTGN